LDDFTNDLISNIEDIGEQIEEFAEEQEVDTTID